MSLSGPVGNSMGGRYTRKQGFHESYSPGLYKSDLAVVLPSPLID